MTEDENRERTSFIRIEKKQNVDNNRIQKIEVWMAGHSATAEADRTKQDEIYKTLYRDGGLSDQARDIKTSIRNIWAGIVLSGILIGIVSNWTKLFG